MLKGLLVKLFFVASLFLPPLFLPLSVRFKTSKVRLLSLAHRSALLRWSFPLLTR